MTGQSQISTQAKSQQSNKGNNKANEVAELKARIDNLERCIAHIATLTGQANYLNQYGFTRVEPTRKEMGKH